MFGIMYSHSLCSSPLSLKWKKRKRKLEERNLRPRESHQGTQSGPVEREEGRGREEGREGRREGGRKGRREGGKEGGREGWRMCGKGGRSGGVYEGVEKYMFIDML